ncbi:MAG: phosphate propanoyltransferase [Actinobacteria bacterium]|nr:phosphate propanoyltransferase [Actinomycetota bacterium]
MEETQLIQKITEEVLRLVSQKEAPVREVEADNRIPIGVSVRHAHLSREDLDKLYGEGYELTRKSDLSQPGNFAANEVVTVVGKRLRSISDVRILAPLRKQTQVELTRTDCIILGVDAPVRPSGDLKSSASIVLVGPKGSVNLSEGAIRANRHIHCDESAAKRLGIKDEDIVTVRIPGEKETIFKNVQVRVIPGSVLEMHVDTDDANAADVMCGTYAELVR